MHGYMHGCCHRSRQQLSITGTHGRTQSNARTHPTLSRHKLDLGR